MLRWLPMVWLLGCGGDAGTPDSGTPAVATDEPVLPDAFEGLAPRQHARRASIALRGVPPTLAELDAVAADPDVLPELVDGWLDDPRFAETVKDLYAEALQVRADTRPILPPVGLLSGWTEADLYEAVAEAPLNLVERVVVDERPLTDLLTAESVYGNEVLARVHGLDGWDPEGPAVQPLSWTDGRPVAGLLSDATLWMRHESNGLNYHRGRANLVSEVFLCDDIGSRDVVVPGDLDLADEDVVADAVQTVPACAGCHDGLDPLAAHFAGFKRTLRRFHILQSYNEFGCSSELDPRGYAAADWCYPLVLFNPDQVAPDEANLQPTALAGQPTAGLADLGAAMADDPRFAECQARRFVSYLTQKDLRDVPGEAVAAHTSALTISGFSARELARSIVLSDAFAAEIVLDPDRAPTAAGLLTLRPQQQARWLEEVTGFTWEAVAGCGPSGCWPVVDLLRTDLYGFRSMAGSSDGNTISEPVHTATPTRVLVLQRVAAEAAGHVVERDLSPGAEPQLLTEVDGSDAGVDAQLEALWLRLHGVELDSETRVGLRALYDGVVDRGDGEAEAFRLVLTALLQDPGVVFY